MFGTDTQHGQVVRFLLEAGSDPNPVSVEGQTAADLAAEQGCDALQRIIEVSLLNFQSVNLCRRMWVS